MDTVECTLHGDLVVRRVDLASRSDELGVALAGPVVAPTSDATVCTQLFRAVKSTVAGFTPTGTVHAQPVVRAVIQTHRGTAVWPTQLGGALANAIHALTRGTTAVRACLNRAIGACESDIADTRPVHTAATRLASSSA